MGPADVGGSGQRRERLSGRGTALDRPVRVVVSARSARSSFGRRGCRRCRMASWWRGIKISAVFHVSSRRESRGPAASRVIGRNANRRHMTADHCRRTVGRATMLVRPWMSFPARTGCPGRAGTIFLRAPGSAQRSPGYPLSSPRPARTALRSFDPAAGAVRADEREHGEHRQEAQDESCRRSTAAWVVRVVLRWTGFYQHESCGKPAPVLSSGAVRRARRLR